MTMPMSHLFHRPGTLPPRLPHSHHYRYLLQDHTLDSILLLFSTCVQTLFDTGASCSFISAACVSALGLDTEPLENQMTIASPLSASLPVNLICRGCELEVSNIRLTCDLCVIEMVDFDLIMEMDWLSTHRAVVDCHQKIVTALPLMGHVSVLRGIDRL